MLNDNVVISSLWKLKSGFDENCVTLKDNLSQFSLLLQLFPSLDKVQGLGEVLHRGLGVLVVQGADGVLAQLLCPGHLVIGQGS